MRREGVRTTITLPREQQVLLRTLAAKRGHRGYSRLIAEALDFYFKEKAAKEVQELLKMRTKSKGKIRRTR